jgi:hypothetical protein
VAVRDLRPVAGPVTAAFPFHEREPKFGMTTPPYLAMARTRSSPRLRSKKGVKVEGEAKTGADRGRARSGTP